jgi:hypothetical protein
MSVSSYLTSRPDSELLVSVAGVDWDFLVINLLFLPVRRLIGGLLVGC